MDVLQKTDVSPCNRRWRASACPPDLRLPLRCTYPHMCLMKGRAWLGPTRDPEATRPQGLSAHSRGTLEPRGQRGNMTWDSLRGLTASEFRSLSLPLRGQGQKLQTKQAHSFSRAHKAPSPALSLRRWGGLAPSFPQEFSPRPLWRFA